MKIIGIETSGLRGGVAFLDTALDRSKEFRFTRGMVHGRALVPAIQKGLKQLKWPLSAIGLIAVDIGPGSYTGLRVGIAAAKTLIYALHSLYPKSRVRLVGVSSLDALAANISPEHKFICPIIDARWRQVYTALYQLKGTQYRRCSDYQAIVPEDWVTQLPRPVLVFGDGLTNYRTVFQKPGIVFGAEKFWYPRPNQIARLGCRLAQEGKFSAPEKIAPLYLRLTEAEMKTKPQILQISRISRD